VLLHFKMIQLCAIIEIITDKIHLLLIMEYCKFEIYGLQQMYQNKKCN
jgi:hypothetical protein